MSPEHNPEETRKEIQELREELAKARQEIPKQLSDDILTERFRRAEKHSDYMRNWLAICSLVITVLFIGFGFLGIRSYLDIDSLHTQIRKAADEVSEKKKEVDDSATKAGQITQGLEDRVQALSNRMTDLEDRYQTVSAGFDSLKGDLNRTKVGVQQNRIDTSNLRSNLGKLAEADPVIFQSPNLIGYSGSYTIEGKNFGQSRGHLMVYVQPSTVGANTGSQVEIEASSIHAWNDTTITFVISSDDELAIKAVITTSQTQQFVLSSFAFLSFGVVTSSGKASGWSSSVVWTGPRSTSGIGLPSGVPYNYPFQNPTLNPVPTTEPSKPN